MDNLENGLKLRVGEEVPIKRGWIKKHLLIYAGMINDRIASIVINNAYSHNSWAYNLYLHRYPYEVTTKYGKIYLLRFSADELVARLERL
jgi:hypothetical protein